MQTNTQSTTCQHLLDEEWIIVINEEIAARPETLAEVVEPELLGRFEAEMGLPCEPMKYYMKLGDIEAYIVGWKDTQAVLAERLADTEDYEQDIMDRDWWSRGQW